MRKDWNARRLPLVPYFAGILFLVGCSYGPEETVTLEISGVADVAQREEIEEQLKTLTDGSGHSMSTTATGDSMTVELAPVSDVEAFAGKIDFGEVTSVDGRTVKVAVGAGNNENDDAADDQARGGDGNEPSPTVPYSIDDRPKPTGSDVDMLLPNKVGSFERESLRTLGDVEGDPVYATYKADEGTVFVELGITQNAAAAREGLATAMREIGAEGSENAQATSLGTEPSYFKTSSERGAFMAWTRGPYYFSAHAKRGGQDLDAFMSAFPY